MSDPNQLDARVWNCFFDFIFSDEQTLTREEVQAELRQLGVDVRPALRRVQQALQRAQETEDARGSLERAKARRSSVLGRLNQLHAPPGPSIRDTLKKMILERLAGPEQAIYARKLENAASDEDLKSLLEDIARLDAFSKDMEDDKP